MDAPSTNEEQLAQMLSLKNLVKVPMFTFGLLAQVLIYGAIGFLTPTMAIHMKEYGMEMFWIGVFFSLPAVMYIVGSLLIPCYLSFIGRRGVIFLAFMLLCLGIFMVGTSPLLNFPDTPKLMFAGLMFLGLAAAAITIPVLPEMLEQIILTHPALANSEELNDITSGYFNGCLGVGEAIGPIVASLLTASIGFRTSCDALAITLLFYTILFFCFNGRCSMFHLQDESDGSQSATDGGSYIRASAASVMKSDDDFKRIELDFSDRFLYSGCKSDRGSIQTGSSRLIQK